jgi:hypothetical protein
LSTLDDDVDIDCPMQQPGMGTLRCRGAASDGSDATSKTTPEICVKCNAGRIYREVGCDQWTAEVNLQSLGNVGILSFGEEILCVRRRRATTLEYCQTCPLVTAETTRQVTTITKGLLQAQLFGSAYRDFERARESLRGADSDGALTSSISMLESTMKHCLDRMGVEYAGEDVTGLWRLTSRVLKIDEISHESTRSLGSTLMGCIKHLGGLRNQRGDAHGRGDDVTEVPEMLAEFVFNSSCAILTLIVRRFIELQEERNG